MVLVCCMVYLMTSDPYIENYETLVRNITDTECGNICTEGLNCMGFAYKQRDKNCYLSREPIFGKPMDSKYSEMYSKLDKRCNKIDSLTDLRLVDMLSLTQNSVYSCNDGEVGVSTRSQYAMGGHTILDGVTDSVQNVPEKVSYRITPIKWNDEMVTKVEKNKQDDHTKIRHHAYVESDKEHLGQYMTRYRCISNIPLYSCLKACDERSDCVGVEHSPVHVSANQTYYNVCCPKRMTDRVIERRPEYKMGKFYSKQTNISEERDSVRITR